MRRLPRRLALWGGAAAVAGGGFAFMNSNAVPATSAGDGASAVTGYTVSDIAYTPVPGTTTELLLSVSFELKGLNMPTQVIAQPYNGTTALTFPLGLQSGWGNIQHTFGSSKTTYSGEGCYVTSPWVTTTYRTTGGKTVVTTLGHGTFFCHYTHPYIAPVTKRHPGPKIRTITSLDIEANQ